MANKDNITVITGSEPQLLADLEPESTINYQFNNTPDVAVSLTNTSQIRTDINDENNIISEVEVGTPISAEIPDINYIPDYKIAEMQRRENEAQRIAYYNEIQEKVNNGDFDGEDGFSPIITTSKEGKETTITIVDAEGTKTATILDGDDATDKNYTFIQNVATDTWEITHNLNKYPSVSVIDSSGAEVIGEVTYLSLNDLIIKFDGGFKGTASLN